MRFLILYDLILHNKHHKTLFKNYKHYNFKTGYNKTAHRENKGDKKVNWVAGSNPWMF